ncbi:hypothetical protein D3C73_1271490 [compost metagenome]
MINVLPFGSGFRRTVRSMYRFDRNDTMCLDEGHRRYILYIQPIHSCFHYHGCISAGNRNLRFCRSVKLRPIHRNLDGLPGPDPAAALLQPEPASAAGRFKRKSFFSTATDRNAVAFLPQIGEWGKLGGPRHIALLCSFDIYDHL